MQCFKGILLAIMWWIVHTPPCSCDWVDSLGPRETAPLLLPKNLLYCHSITACYVNKASTVTYPDFKEALVFEDFILRKDRCSLEPICNSNKIGYLMVILQKISSYNFLEKCHWSKHDKSESKDKEILVLIIRITEGAFPLPALYANIFPVLRIMTGTTTQMFTKHFKKIITC